MNYWDDYYEPSEFDIMMSEFKQTMFSRFYPSNFLKTERFGSSVEIREQMIICRFVLKILGRIMN